MKISSLLFVLFFSSSLFAASYTFIDRPLKLETTKEGAKVTFLMRATSYLVTKDSDCFKEIEKAIKNEGQLNVTFSPKDLRLEACQSID